MNPLSVKTKVNNLSDGRVCLEIQIQNLATIPLCLELMDFEVNELFTSEDLNSFKTKVISPQDIIQKLYILSSKKPNDLAARTTPSLGRLDLHWKSTMGQAGHLQTSQLVRKLPSINPFELHVLEQPSVVNVEKPFKLKMRIQNNLSGERVRLSISGVKSKMSNILMQGSNYLDIGVLDGQTHHDFDLDLFPIMTGLFKVAGLVVTDKISGSSFELDSVATIKVMP